MTIQSLSSNEQTQLAIGYMKRSRDQLASLATTMGIDPAGLSKPQLAGAIVAGSMKADVQPTRFDMSGLYICTGAQR